MGEDQHNLHYWGILEKEKGFNNLRSRIVKYFVCLTSVWYFCALLKWADSGTKMSGFESQLCYLLAVSDYMNYIFSLWSLVKAVMLVPHWVVCCKNVNKLIH